MRLLGRQRVQTVDTLTVGQAGLEKLCALLYTRQYLVAHRYMSIVSASCESAWQPYTMCRHVEYLCLPF